MNPGNADGVGREVTFTATRRVNGGDQSRDESQATPHKQRLESNVTTTGQQAAPARRGAVGPSRPPSQLKSDAEIDSASRQLPLAAALCGLADGKNLTCPWCGTSKRGTVQLVTSTTGSYFKCHKCKGFAGATKLVQEILGVSFPEAVDLLNGKNPDNTGETDEHRSQRLAEAAKRAEAMAKNSFKAELSEQTVAVYNAVLASANASLPEAVRYYATWHVSAEAVATVGFVYITEPDALARELVATFSVDTIVKSGVAVPVEEGSIDRLGLGLRFMFSANYPVVEPQIGPSGNCMSMQFRPSAKQKAKISAHKRGGGPYVPAFMSLRGAGADHMVGIGLEYLCKLAPTRVDIVEGAKDVAADLTLGNKAFGMPGTGVLPPAKSVKALAKAGHSLRICMDGDKAGRDSQQMVFNHLVANGFPEARLTIHEMPTDMDIADVLVSRHAAQGCTCATCTDWRKGHSTPSAT